MFEEELEIYETISHEYSNELPIILFILSSSLIQLIHQEIEDVYLDASSPKYACVQKYEILNRSATTLQSKPKLFDTKSVSDTIWLVSWPISTEDLSTKTIRSIIRKGEGRWWRLNRKNGRKKEWEIRKQFLRAFGLNRPFVAEKKTFLYAITLKDGNNALRRLK